MHELATLREALQESPDNVRLWLLYGQTCVTSDSLGDAREAFETALMLDPDDPEAQLGIAKVLFQEGKLSEAVIRLECLTQENGAFAPAHVLLSRILLTEKDATGAIEHYEMAKTLSKSISDKELESELALYGHSPNRREREEEDRQRLVANAGWDANDDFDFGLPPTPFDDDMAEFGGSPTEQEEFDLGEENFNFDDFERPKGKFTDVAGLEEVKEELRMRLIYPYEYQDLYRAYNKKPGGGILLHGPPGCGKSLVCRALAGETEANFYSLKLHQILEMYIGCSEKNLHAVFNQARENAPSVIFIDELDALGADRSELKQNAARTVVNQFLMELDGFDGANEGVLVIAATSAIENVDPAFLRPGRFDRRIHVGPPTQEGREKILKLQTRNRPVDRLDYPLLASKLDNYSGADIAQVFESAIDDALRIAMRKRDVVPITTPMVEAAIERIVPSIPLWLERQNRRQTEK